MDLLGSEYVNVLVLGMSLTVKPLCIGLISVLLSHTGSRHRNTGPFEFGNMMKLLHYSAILSPP